MIKCGFRDRQIVSRWDRDERPSVYDSTVSQHTPSYKQKPRGWFFDCETGDIWQWTTSTWLKDQIFFYLFFQFWYLRNCLFVICNYAVSVNILLIFLSVFTDGKVIYRQLPNVYRFICTDKKLSYSEDNTQQMLVKNLAYVYVNQCFIL